MFGTFEGSEWTAVSRYLRTDLDTLELGAGIGCISCAIARMLEPSRHLVAVEPDLEGVALTRENLQHNAPNANAIVINAMVNYSTEISISPFGSFKATEAERAVIPSVKLRDLVAQHFKGDYQLVMDIEGSELGLILNDRAALSSCRLIIAEFHSSTADGRLYHDYDMIQVLADYGFTKCRRMGTGANFVISRGQ